MASAQPVRFLEQIAGRAETGLSGWRGVAIREFNHERHKGHEEKKSKGGETADHTAVLNIDCAFGAEVDGPFLPFVSFVV